MRILLTADQQASIEAEQKAFRDSLPKGKPKARFVKEGACWRLYKGRHLVLGCSGSSEEECFEHYETSLGDISEEEKKKYY